LIALVIVANFMPSGLTQGIRADSKQSSVNENASTIESNNLNDLKIISHPATQEEIAGIKQKMGVRDPNKDYNVIYNGHGTGFAPPTETSYEKMVGHLQIVEPVAPSLPLSTSFDLSADPCFPIVGNQGGQGSCAAWAATYYATGYVIGKNYDWNQAHTGNMNQLLSPAWTYNKCNKGVDSGSYPPDNMVVSQTVGVCRLSQMPYDDNDPVSWGTENAWRDAPSYRVKTVYDVPHDINTIKTIVSNGHPVTFALNADSYDYFGSDDVLGSSAMQWFPPNLPNHANTVVGYDDTKVDHETSEVGAFKIVNSWGLWGPNHNGYYWMTYDAFLGWWWNYNSLNYVDVLYANTYPKLLGVWNLNSQPDRSAPIELGIGPYSSPLQTRSPVWDGSSNQMHTYPTFMCLDISEFYEKWMTGVNSFYLKIGDASNDGRITSFKIEYYNSTYIPGNPTRISSESPNTPKNTPCYVTLSFSNQYNWWPMLHHDLSHSGYSTSNAPDTNALIWSYTQGSYVDSSPAVANGKVYFGSDDHNVYCLNAFTGAGIWSYTTGNSVHYSSPAVANGKVYVGSYDHKVYCLNASTGAYIWSYTTGSSVDSSPAVANGKVYVGSDDDKVYCLNASTGALIWSYATGQSVGCSSPSVINGKVYIGSSDKKVYCFNVSTGAYIWSYTTGNYVLSSPAVINGKVYISSDDYKVYCLNASTGAYIWSYTTGSYTVSSPAVANGKVYVGSDDDKVYCLNASTGAWIWSYTTGNYVLSSPAVANGKVYVGSYDHKVYCLNASTGAWIWSYTTGSSVFSSPAVADNKVYIGSEDGKVYCFGPSFYVGNLHIEKSTSNYYITTATIPNINVPTNGGWVTFWADYYMDCPGPYDDGYVDISFTDGTDIASAYTGSHLEGKLFISHFLIPGQQVTIKLYLICTDILGMIRYTVSEIKRNNSAATLPDAPSNLNAYNPTLTSIDLTWTKGIGADKTNILRKTDGYPSSPTDGTQVYFGAGKSFTDAGLNTETTYYYRAWSYYTAIDAYSTGYSQDYEATNAPPNNPPNMPSNPAPANGATNIQINTDLSWTGGDPNNGDTVTYDVYFGTTSTPSKILPGNQSSTTYNPGSLNYLTTYYWRIIAWDNHGASATGPTWSFTTQSQPNNPPYAPSNPNPTDGASGVTITTDLNWTGGDPDPGNSVTYDVYFGTTSLPQKKIGNQTGTTYDPGTLNYSSTYYWRIVVWDNHNAKTVGLLWHFTTITQPNQPPNTPSNPTPVNNSNNIDINTQITWTGGDPDQEDTITYDVYFGITSTPLIQIHNQSATVYNPGILNFQTTYYWRIIAWDNHQAKTIGPLWHLTTKAQTNQPPNIPSNPAPQNNSNNIPFNQQLTWTGGDPDQGDTVTYDVYFGTTSTPSKILPGNQSSTTYNPGSLNYLTTYYWRIIAWDNRGASTPGPIWDFTTTSIPNNPPYQPGSPTPLNHANGVNISSSLSWTGGDPDVGDTILYDVYFGTTNPPPKVSANQSGSSYQPMTMNYLTTYHWRVAAWDAHGASTTGLAWDFTTEAAVNHQPYLPSDPVPSNHANGVGVNTDLSWNGGDPDPGDTVTYDVYFGITSPPPKVIGNQSIISYATGTMNYLTTYHWMIVAWDSHGASTQSSLWDFTTAAEVNNPPYIPTNPSPENGSTSVEPTVVLNWIGGDPDHGDTVTYDVFFGITDPPQKLVSNQSGSSYQPTPLVYNTTYYWRIVSWDAHGVSTSGPLWHFTTNKQQSDCWPMFQHDSSHSGYSTSKAPITNNVIWNYHTGAASSPAVADGKVYIGSDDGNVYCLNASTGEQIWSYFIGSYVNPTPAILNGKVYIAANNYKIYCLNATNGASIWNFTTGGLVISSPTVADGRVYIGSEDHKVYCLDADTGGCAWSFLTSLFVISSPAVADGKVYIGSEDHNVYCLNASTGHIIWGYTTGYMVDSSPTVADGKVYFGSEDYKVYCLNAANGTKIWDYMTGYPIQSSPAVADGKVYIGSNDSKVYCLNATNGERIWSYLTGNFVIYSPAVADGKVYIGSEDCKIYCLNALNGTKIWDYMTGSTPTSPAIADGKIYVGSGDGNVYCFGSSLNRPPNKPTNPSPTNGATGIDINPTLQVYVTDPDADSMTVRFYNAANNNLIGTKNMVSNGATASFTWSGLNFDTAYQWYAVVNDSFLQNKSETWTFTTKTSDNGGGGGGGGEMPPAGPQNKYPIANASAGEPYRGFVNSEILFDGSRSYDPDGNITKWLWVFGDNTNGTGKTVRHTYSKAGTYTVTLTVTDNEGATNKDTTTAIVTVPNRPPAQPTIVGPTEGHKNILYTYVVTSTDQDNDTLRYSVIWGDETSYANESGFIPSGTSFNTSHKWIAAGKYQITASVTDNKTMTTSYLTVMIDAINTGDIGYLTDDNGDGTYETYHNKTTNQNTVTEKKGNTYLIDTNGDGAWDYTYDLTAGLTAYTSPPKTPGFELVIIVCAVALVLFWKRKKK